MSGENVTEKGQSPSVGCGCGLGASAPTLAMHKARANRRGLSRWTVNTPRGKRSLQLQAYKGRLYLYGQMIERPRGGPEHVVVRFEAPVREIVRTYGPLSSPNTEGSRAR